MKKEVYIRHREVFLNSLEENSIAILFAGNALKKTGDEFYQFTPDRNFYYLTGIQEENHIVVLTKFKGKTTEKLFLKEIDLAKELWNGKTLRDSEGREISGIEDTVYMNEFNGYLNGLIKGADEVNLYLDLDKQSMDEGDSKANLFARKMRDI